MKPTSTPLRAAPPDVDLRDRVHQQAEDALRDSEQRLRILFECAPDAYYLSDLEGRFLDGNLAAEELVGWRREEFVGKNLAELNLLDEEGLATAARGLARNARGEPSGPDEYSVRRKDGTRVTVEIRTYPVSIQNQVQILGIARNITARREAERDLRSSEKLFRSIWEHSVDAMMLADRHGRIIDVNAAFCRLVRIPRERLLGELFTVAYDASETAELLAQFNTSFDTGRFAPRLSTRVTLWNAESLDLEISRSFIELGERGTMMLNILRDVTSRKQAELRSAAFARLGQRLGSARTAREAGEIIVDVAGQLLGWDACTFDLWSPATNRLLPVLRMDLLGGKRTEASANAAGQEPSAVVRRALEQGGQLILKSDPGKMLPDAEAFGDVARPSASILMVPLRHDSQVVGLLSIHSYRANAYDQQSLETLQALADHCGGVLQRISAREALDAAQRRLEDLLAASPAVIYSLRIKDGDLVPAWASRSIQQLLGWSAQEVIRPGWWAEHVHPEDLPPLLDRLEQVLAKGEVAHDYRLRHKNGGYRWIRDQRRLVRGPAGEPLEVAGSMVDITEHKRLEDLLRQAQKMEAVGQLAGGVAHDFNNLLAVIRGNADLILLEEAQLPIQSLECLRQIIAAAERAANLSRQLLAFGRKHVIRSQPVLLNTVVMDLAKMLRRVIGEHIDLRFDYEAELPYVLADAGMIEQVVVNLVVNARDAMPGGGRLEVRTAKAQLSEQAARENPEARAGEFACLIVRDTGSGITAEQMPRIFEPFFTTKEFGKGTGLGLAMVYGIVKQHQGWIEVVSQPGVGTVFSIFLPAVAVTSKPVCVIPPGTRPPGGAETILLVEDDEAVRSTTRRILQNAGYGVEEAARSSEALEIWKRASARIQLVLTDILMPHGMSGRELAERLQAERPDLKILFMSGYSPAESGKDLEFFRWSEGRILQKPCSANVLLEAVRKYLDTPVSTRPGDSMG